MRFSERLGLPDDAPRVIKLAVGFYLAHLSVEWWISGSQIFLSLAVVFSFLGIIHGPLRFRFHELYLPMGLFLVASTLSAALSARPFESLGEISEWLSFLTFLVGITLCRSVDGLAQKGADVLLWWGCLIATYGLAQYLFFGFRDLEHRMTGPTPHVMTFSGILLATVFIAIARFLHGRRPIHGAAAALLTTTLILTLTRSAWLGWVAGVIAIAALRRSRSFLLLAPVAVIVLTALPLPIFGRLMSSFDPGQYSNLDRIRMVEAGIAIVADHPVAGVGPGMIGRSYPNYRKPDAPRFHVPHLHNNVVQLWAERGILAMIGYFLIVGLAVARFTKDSRDGPRSYLSEAAVGATVALFVAGWFEFNFGDSEVLMTWLDICALAGAGTVPGLVSRVSSNGSDGSVVQPEKANLTQ